MSVFREIPAAGLHLCRVVSFKYEVGVPDLYKARRASHVATPLIEQLFGQLYCP